VTKQPDLPSRDLGSSQDPITPKALGHEADNRREAIKAMSEVPLPWNSVYAPPKHIAEVSDLVLNDPEGGSDVQ